MPSRTTIFACFTLGYFISFFFRAANAVIARDLSVTFDLDASQLGLMTSLFFVTFALVQLPIGAALDRYGPTPVTASVMLIAVIGALTFAFAPSFEILALGRALIGAGMACGLMGLLKIFGQWFPTNRVATISGIAVGTGALGGIAASVPLAWLNAQIGWQAIFIGAALATLLAAAGIFFATANTPTGRQQPQLASAAHGQAPAGGFGLIFRDWRFWRIAPLNFFMIGTLQSIQTLWGGPFLIDVLGLSKIDAGAPLLALSLGVVVGYFSSGWLADHVGLWQAMSAGVIVFALTLVPLIIPGFVPPLLLLYLAFFINGYTGAFNLLLLGQVRSLFPPGMSGRATTALNMFGFFGTAIIQWAMGVVISQFPSKTNASYPPIAYTIAFGAAAIGYVVAMLWYLPLSLRQSRNPR
ncbi:MAG: MFS transporter [Roseiflexaceae bacterium]